VDYILLKNEIERLLPMHFDGSTRCSLAVVEVKKLVKLVKSAILSDPEERASLASELPSLERKEEYEAANNLQKDSQVAEVK